LDNGRIIEIFFLLKYKPQNFTLSSGVYLFVLYRELFTSRSKKGRLWYFQTCSEKYSDFQKHCL